VNENFKKYFGNDELTFIQNHIFETIKNSLDITKFLETLWKSNFEDIGFGFLVDEMFEIIEKSAGKKDGEVIQQIETIFLNKDFKRYARKSRKNTGSKMQFGYELVKNYLNGANTFLDFGAGKLALIRRIARENPNIQKFYGFDPGSNPDYISFDERVEFINDFDKLKNLKNIDVIYSSFVFHHLTAEEIDNSLKLIKSILAPNGKFILVEESFPIESTFELENNSKAKLESLGYSLNKEASKLFEKLSTKEKFLAIYLNDVLINLKNLSYMPWTFEYKSMEEWRKLLKDYGFELDEEYAFGLIDSKRLKQGLTTMQVFRLQISDYRLQSNETI
jgi:SAM-dependent methyltransferase